MGLCMVDTVQTAEAVFEQRFDPLTDRQAKQLAEKILAETPFEKTNLGPVDFWGVAVEGPKKQRNDPRAELERGRKISMAKRFSKTITYQNLEKIVGAILRFMENEYGGMRMDTSGVSIRTEARWTNKMERNGYDWFSKQTESV